MHVGGSVWALEWCPRVHEDPDAQAKCEFQAVPTHPPDSYSHKIGIPLTGRGIIQIWCLPNRVNKGSCSKQRRKLRSWWWILWKYLSMGGRNWEISQVTYWCVVCSRESFFKELH